MTSTRESPYFNCLVPLLIAPCSSFLAFGLDDERASIAEPEPVVHHLQLQQRILDLLYRDS